ncbi:MAG: aldehyde ferredoxin oxidoreductase C-terminal domain-containing protein [Anaerolineaceae bacterium]|nr:aldehyde ferredoxin oxidoreductase C-terminal domain-containing protein [Anaerolineaceae bacterium]
MGYGSTGKILRVNLSSGAIQEESFDESFYRRYPGGKALAGYFLLCEVPQNTHPLSPENLLVLANGLLTGSPIPTTTRFTAAARSPLTGGYGESEAGGYFGPELKMAGYEAVLISGRAASPVYLSIEPGHAVLKNASHLWGQDPDVVQKQIRSELEDDKVQVLQIGIAGEKQVFYAALTHELRHYNGRNGIGAVMGSKNLKAVAVRGSRAGQYRELAYAPQEMAALGQRLAKDVKNHPQSWDMHEKGTVVMVAGFQAAGILPTHNFHSGAFDSAAKINLDSIQQEILDGRGTCFACAVRCKPRNRSGGRYDLKPEYGGPEYEAVAGFGSNCGIDDLQAVAKANELCNRYVMDTISTSATIAFAMECFENGLIGLKETGGLDLRFGNVEAMLQAVEQIAHRTGFGNLMADGSLRLAQTIGGKALDYTMQVKGQELPMHDPRGKNNVGLGFAISETGADHLVSIHDTLLQNPDSVSFKAAQALGIQSALPARLLNDEKVATYLICESWISLEKVLGLCYFGPAPRSFMQVADVIALVRAATGWDVDLAELQRIGERATNMARIFNIRQGFLPADDDLPKRLFDPLEGGPLTGVAYSRQDFKQALLELYRLKGWDPISGMPLPETLQRLELSDWIQESSTITIHLGGHLSFYSPQKQSHLSLSLNQPTALVGILQGLGLPLAEVAVASVNGELVELAAAQVKPGDKIDLYPPMGGG